MANETIESGTINPDILSHLGLGTGQTVADFGAGGVVAWARPMSAVVGPNGRVLMFEVNKASLQAALSRAKLHGLTNCHGVWANLEVYRGARGINDNSLDAGLMADLLNQSKHHREILAEVHRMLKPGAKLLIIDWKKDSAHRLAPLTQRRLAGEYLATLGKGLGFAPLELFIAGPDHWGLTLVKT